MAPFASTTTSLGVFGTVPIQIFRGKLFPRAIRDVYLVRRFLNFGGCSMTCRHRAIYSPRVYWPMCMGSRCLNGAHRGEIPSPNKMGSRHLQSFCSCSAFNRNTGARAKGGKLRTLRPPKGPLNPPPTLIAASYYTKTNSTVYDVMAAPKTSCKAAFRHPEAANFVNQ